MPISVRRDGFEIYNGKAAAGAVAPPGGGSGLYALSPKAEKSAGKQVTVGYCPNIWATWE